ncbi:DUF6895 family protein [Pseudonocardia sp. CA-107938]|uniref:DUF6895 family protein n=1 Tax=Pseudonocardia sp. CA-107938 TaxID=3240021 RepID=UPI003D8E94DC
MTGATTAAHPAPLLLDSALDWLTANGDWFRPEKWEQELGIRREFYAQPVLELLLAGRSLAPRRPDLATAVTGRALAIAESVVDSDDVRTALLDRGARFEEWLFLLTVVHASGSPRPQLLAALQTGLDDDPDIGPIEHPVQLVVRRYLLDLGALRHPTPPMADVARAAMRALDRDADSLDEMDVYGFTHLLLYASDFGADPLPFEPAPTRRLVRELLPAQIGRDHDLTAELLACAELVGLGADPLVREGWAALRRAQHPDGAVPSPPYDAAVEATVPAGQLAGYRFATRYHTTLATVLAAAQCGEGPR